MHVGKAGMVAGNGNGGRQRAPAPKVGRPRRRQAPVWQWK